MAVVTLTTDFGHRDPYVAEMLGRNPGRSQSEDDEDDDEGDEGDEGAGELVDALSLDDVLFSAVLFSELPFSLGAAGLFVPLFSDSRAFLREAEG